MASKEATTFWDHLEELRGVLFRVAGVVVVLGVASFCLVPWLFEHFVMAPANPDFITYRLIDRIAGLSGAVFDSEMSVNIVSLELTSQFFVHMSAACWFAFLVGFPIILYLLWGFVAPALYEHEKKGARMAFLFGNVMFYLGASVGYFIVFPIAMRFLAGYSLSNNITPMISLESYMDNFFTLLLLMGAVFELPLLAWILGKIGLLTKGFFSKYRRHAIVVLLIVAALITPTGDPFTLLIVFVPIYALWEGSALLVPATKPEPDYDESDTDDSNDSQKA